MDQPIFTMFTNDRTLYSTNILQIMLISGADSTLVHKNVASKNHNVYYEAKLIGTNGERILKPKKVLCYVSPKQLIIKELILKFIPKRIYTFRLCPSTKVPTTFFCFAKIHTLSICRLISCRNL